MYNTILFLVMVIVGLAGMALAFRLFGKAGIFAMISTGIVVTNILIVKSFLVFGLGASGNAVLFSMIYLGTDMLSEFFGGKEARKAVFIGFFVSIFIAFASYMTLIMIPAPFDWANDALTAVLKPMPRIMFASGIAYLTSNLIDTVSYDWIRKKFPKHLWLRNNGSTMSSSIVDGLIFCSLAFIGVLPMYAVFQIFITGYIFKLIIAALDTPFLYLIKRQVKKHPEILTK